MKNLLPAVAIAAGMTSACASAADSAQPANPNIVVILADDLRADCIGAVNPRIYTPNIDRIAKQGVRFSNSYIMGGNSAAVCTPLPGHVGDRTHLIQPAHRH